MSQTPDLLEEIQIPIRRRTLLPWWIKVFCWIFMVAGAGAVLCLVMALSGYRVSLAIYGFETNGPISPVGLLIIAVFIFKAFTAFALWFEKDHAITLAKIDAISGIILCLFSMFVMPYLADTTNYPRISFRLELLLLIPYFIRLNKIQKSWLQEY